MSSKVISFATGSLSSDEHNEDVDLLRKKLQSTLISAAQDVESLLHYSNPVGTNELREKIAELVHSWTAPITKDSILITSSAQQGLAIVFEYIFCDFIKANCRVFVQEPCYFGTLRILKKQIHKKIDIVSFQSLESVLSEITAGDVIYLTSNFQNPTGLSLSDEQKNSLSKRAVEVGAIVVEDNPYDFLFYPSNNNNSSRDLPTTVYEKAPNNTIYVGSFSKIVAPGIRVGYVIANPSTIQRLKSFKLDQDIYTSTLCQQICHQFLSDNHLLKTLRTTFQRKRDLCVSLLKKYFHNLPGVSWIVPEGGIFLFIEMQSVTLSQIEKFTKNYLELEQLSYFSVQRYFQNLNNPTDQRQSIADLCTRSTRINFVQNSDEDLEDGIRTLAKAYRMVIQPVSVLVTSGQFIQGNFKQEKHQALNSVILELLSHGFHVHYLHKEGVAAPSNLVTYHAYSFNDENDFGMKLKEIISNAANKIKVALYAETQDLRSDGKTLLSAIKAWNPRVFLARVDDVHKNNEPLNITQIIDGAYAVGIKNHCNLNISFVEVEQGKTQAIFITPEKGISFWPLTQLPAQICDTIFQRSSENHYKTTVTTNEEYLTTYQKEIHHFREIVNRLFKLNVFEEYLPGNNQHFGFVALRLNSEPKPLFLISSRASNKKDMPLDDIVLITNVDFASREVFVTSLKGKKASLNANIAAKIFYEQPEVSLIIHGHIFPGLTVSTKTDYSPGTQEDVDEVFKYVRKSSAVELVNHGLIITGKNVDDILKQLFVQPAYTRFSKYYDIIYQRFQTSPDFVDLVVKQVNPKHALLDLAGGTGIVSGLLVNKHGFTDVSIGDKNQSMLNVAKSRLDIPCFVTDFQTLNLERKYDAIIVRQAINYLMNEEGLRVGFTNICNQLKQGGVFIFNAPNHLKTEVSYSDRELNYESGEYHCKIIEKNDMDIHSILTHTQHCIMIKKDATEIKKLYDVNQFGMFTKQQFETALKQAGFSSILFFGKDLKPLSDESKSLYCVATK